MRFKKIISFVLVLCMLFTLSEYKANAGYVFKGDADKNGVLSTNDARIILQMASGIIPWNLVYADINCDDLITIDDAVLVLRNLAGVEEGNHEPGSIYEVTPNDFPHLPYSVYYCNNKYVTENILNTKGEVDFLKIYVNSISGDDINSGELLSPVQSLKKALQLYQQKNLDCEIIVLNKNAVFYADDYFKDVIIKKSLIIKGNDAKIVAGQTGDWQKYNNIYYCNADFVPVSCVNLDETFADENGIYENMIKTDSITECENTLNSYCILDRTVYVNVKCNVDEVSIMKKDFSIRWNHILATKDSFIYLDNLNFVSGVLSVVRSTASEDDVKNIELFAENCKFQHAYNTDGLVCANYNNTYLINCDFGFSKKDLMNISSPYLTAAQKAQGVNVAINCTARDAGNFDKTKGINNLYTGHNGINILRLNCTGHTSYGPMFADVNGCRSVNIDCFGDNSNVEANYPIYSFNNINSQYVGKATLFKCSGKTQNDFLVESQCDIELGETELGCNSNITGAETTIGFENIFTIIKSNEQ